MEAVWYVALLILPSSALGQVCDVSDILPPVDIESEYYAWEQSDDCYIIALANVNFKTAMRFCSRIGGYLTDVETPVESNLQKYLKNITQEHPQLNKEYFIGLLWNFHLYEWLWQNGAERNSNWREPFDGNKPWLKGSSACAFLTQEAVEQCNCYEKKGFICKLNMMFYDNTGNNNLSACSPRCTAFIKEIKSGRSSQIENLTFSTDDNKVTEHIDSKNLTEGNQTACQLQNDSKNILPAVLGCLTASLLVTVLILLALVCKYRRLLNKENTKPKISLVDILKVDSAETHKERSGETSDSRPRSTSELLYTSVDTPCSSPTKDDCQVPKLSDTNYHNPTSAGDRSDSSEASPTSSDAGQTTYSHLNRNEGMLQKAEQADIYGMESASEPFGLSSRTSYTYESYL